MAVRPERRLTSTRHRGPVLALLVVMLAGSMAVGALAAGTSVKLGAAANKALGKTIVVNSSGRSLYTLSPETTHHLLCKSRECLRFWPPLTVPSRTTKLRESSGVHGRLGLLRRSNGVLQVTLRGVPLYRYSGDHAAGDASGEGVESFGGTWHAVTAAASSPSAPITTNPNPPNEPYGY
jgi:predicted lipoprotein with Yx(FWY)xxD motif